MQWGAARACVLLLLLREAAALRFMLKTNQKRCFKEEIHKGIVVKGEYELSDAPGQRAFIHVTDTREHTVYKREDFAETSGKLAFTADEYDIFEICIESRSPPNMHGTDREVNLELKHGIEAKSYDDLAKAENLKPLEVEMRRLEDLSESIVNDFAYMKKREEEMRDTNESTNSRVLYLSVFSLLCLVGLALFQILHMRRYFKSKKLID